MRTLIVSEFMTLDGVMEAPGGEPTHPHTGWVVPYGVPELFQYKLEETLAAGSLLLGRVTYESFASAWPARDGEFADKMNSMPKYVVSGSLENPEWANSTVLSGDLASEISDLKSRYDGDILVAGSARLVQALTSLDLVDEYRLMVFPTILGSGKRLFTDDTEQSDLRLAGTLAAGDCTVLTFRPANRGQ